PKSNGLYITGKFAKLDDDTIKMYMDQSNTSSLPLPLKEIDISADEVNLVGQRLTAAALQIVPNADKWEVNIHSQEIVGEMIVPKDLSANGLITAQFEKMNLRTAVVTKKTSPISAKSLPAISFVANTFSYNDMPLGRIAFKTSPNNNGMSIDILSINSPRLSLQAGGSWTQANVTRLQGKAKSSQVTELLNSLDLDATNFLVKDGEATFSLNWSDAPYAPNLASLNGRASLKLGRGRIVDIGEASGAKMDVGKMLSIFSLQTIPRRLTFDFSDIFQKGYSFDFIRGDFSLQRGDVFTDNLNFDGPVARVHIDGRIGLKKHDVNFVLSVTPYVTSSIPVAATLLTMQPLVGIAAFAVDKVIGTSKVVTHYYQVRGDWDNPSWTAISSQVNSK
ncbi:MAG TPA: AsmA-like C-terminal region-containing protein, partial [Gammaproteobacteria bacterium]|nr:AsmA-like C-terminal region-containing protein [Gammaproteobacteria bacterium]